MGPNFCNYILQIRQYSFHYFLSFGYSEIKKQGRVTFSVFISSYFCKERIKITNVSANNEAMPLKLCRDVASYEIYQVVHILMLLWQHARFLSSCLLGSCLFKIKYYYLRLNKAKFLVLFKKHASPTFIGSALKHF